MLNETEQNLQRVEISLQEAEESVALAEALQRLHDNKDFQNVILTGYFNKESERIVMLKGAANAQNEEQQRSFDKVIIGIGQLGEHFRKIFIFGEQAHRALEEDKVTRQELLQEQLEENTVM